MRRWFLLLCVPTVGLAACGDEELGSSAAPTLPSSASIPPNDSTIPISDAVRVIVTGRLVRAPGRALELCPWQEDRCAGLTVAGAAELFEPFDDGALVRVSGHYDGVALVPDSTPEPVASPWPSGDVGPSCDGGAPGAPDPSIDAATAEAIERYVDSVPDAFAGAWLDPATSRFTYWFVGPDVEAHRSAVEALGGEAVCVIGGARFTLAELLDAQTAFDAIVRDRGIAGASSSVHDPTNTVRGTLPATDPALREQLGELGDRVTVRTFIEVVDRPLDALPAAVPPVTGTVDLLVQRAGASDSMDALGTFVLGFDEARGCLYGEAEGQRYAIVWPAGYSAAGAPVTVFDVDGARVAADGDEVEVGGGYVDTSSASNWTDGTELCGADGPDRLFVVSPESAPR